MERTVLLLKPEQRRKLILLAKKQKVSVAEINRRAIDDYSEMPKEELTALTAMLEVLFRSNQEAKKALEEAEKALDQTLGLMAKSKET